MDKFIEIGGLLKTTWGVEYYTKIEDYSSDNQKKLKKAFSLMKEIKYNILIDFDLDLSEYRLSILKKVVV
ncbi:hypothetical protein [Spiroplasma endosymbiont of Sarcophaga carnaria]|uniref:hypothetical protein n=1 Tax=Spiroplasma endosymbiont of Sarcophaga carnaria TaxID=3066303 RepID=UPI0030D092A2